MVVDCDLRRAQLHQRLGLSREPGFTDDFVRKEPIDVADAGDARPPTCSRSPRARCRPTRRRCSRASSSASCSTRCARDFEWVLVDSPPLASVTDALLLARHADHTLLVVQHNKVDKKLVKRSVERAQEGHRRTCWAWC